MGIGVKIGPADLWVAGGCSVVTLIVCFLASEVMDVEGSLLALGRGDFPSNMRRKFLMLAGENGPLCWEDALILSSFDSDFVLRRGVLGFSCVVGALTQRGSSSGGEPTINVGEGRRVITHISVLSAKLT